MCLEFSSTKILTIYADDVEVGVYEDEVTGTKINFLYQNIDDFCYITRSGSTQSLFYVLSSQVFWIRDEGEIEENDNNMVYDLELVNGADTSDGYSYSCINMYNPSSTDSVLYQQIQIVCGECNEDADYCALKVYIRDGKSQTISAFRYLTDDESLEIEYDGTIEMLTYSYNKIGFELFADELVVYQLEGNNGFEYRPLIGDINFESDGDDADYEADWTAETGEIQEIALNSDGVDVVMDVYCDDDACYLGAQSTNSNTFDVYKEYTGNFDTVSVYYIDDEEDQETCLSFSNDDYTLNHCGFYSQWEMYYHTFSLYPVDTIELTD
jgi:hypothetical protein